MAAPESMDVVDDRPASKVNAFEGQRMLVAEDLHVRYQISEERRARLRDFVAAGFRKRPAREVHALRGVSLTANAGEIIGIVGANGSGKTTLLRSLAGLLPVDEGAIYVRSEPMILGVGAVLNPRLSGRRNVLIGGLAMGLTRDQIEERFDEIVDFSGLEEFIDMPMRAYSTGMRARLHFSIATAVAPEILLIDEALAVGDRDFKERSAEKIRELQDRAGLAVIVSHALEEVRQMCTRVIWLDEGSIRRAGEPDAVLDAYRDHA